MPFLPSIPEDAKVPHVLALFSDRGSRAGRPLIEFHEALLRGESPFTVPQREMMAAFVSGINACEYCYGAHTASSKQFGVPEQLIVDLVANIDATEVEAEIKPVLHYLRKLTLTPTKLTQADADAVFAAGWDERALYDAVLVGCLYNFMNRYTDGLGLSVIPEQFDIEGKMIKELSYKGMLEMGIR
ncbi:MAG: carboxymuconolactone decarboxylase family protein [Acidimicrobiales bacterium]